jgi:microcystin degradation protein MlrC
MDAAEKFTEGTLVIADVADNAGGGAGGDSTYLLAEVLKRGIRDAALAMIYDPGAVNLACAAGVGARIHLRIGGKISKLSGDPLDVEAQVLAVSNNAKQRGLGPQLEPLGKAAAISVSGIDIVLNSRRQQTFSPDCFTELGIDPARKRLLVVKSSHHFFNHFQSIASKVIYCEAPGTLNLDLSGLPYCKIRRPIWPLDDVSFDDW